MKRQQIYTYLFKFVTNVTNNIAPKSIKDLSLYRMIIFKYSLIFATRVVF